MGLDMYLRARKEEYASDYTTSKNSDFTQEYPEELTNFFEQFKTKNIEELGDNAHVCRSVTRYTLYEIGYWRKANAIHNFFVNYCADGVDECQDIIVSKEALEELLDRCNKVLENHLMARELLPTENGFFFGSTDYDKYYFEDIEDTKVIVEKTIQFLIDRQKNDKECYWQIIYKASW